MSAEIINKLKAELAAARKEASGLRKWKADRLGRDTAAAAIRRHGGEASAKLLEPHILPAIRFVDAADDGRPC